MNEGWKREQLKKEKKQRKRERDGETERGKERWRMGGGKKEKKEGQ